MEPKKGIKTSEVQLAYLLVISAVAIILALILTKQTGMIGDVVAALWPLAGVSSSVTLGRSWLKSRQ